jgi:hypothetical protein
MASNSNEFKLDSVGDMLELFRRGGETMYDAAALDG